MTRISPTLLVFVMSLAAPPLWSEPLDGFVSVDRLPQMENPVLSRGRDVWGATCENCHGGNALVGAPKITHDADWAKRIAQGLPVLFAHAIDGFFGPSYKEMPARGGDPDLSDDQVRAAVAFMVSLSGGAQEVEGWLSTQ